MRSLLTKTIFFALLFLFATTVAAQNRTRIPGPVEESALTRLPRTTHRAIQAAPDLGRVSPDVPLERMQLLLSSTPEQQTTLEQLLRNQQDPASPLYHQWLTPQQFGERFGASQAELDAVTVWLRGRGFRIDRIANGRRSIEFSGTAGQVERAFHTELHRYSVNGEVHMANSTDLSIPTAVAAVATGVLSLHDFRARAQHRVLFKTSVRSPAPEYTNSLGEHTLVPYDFATIYDLTRVWGSLGVDGTGQKIAIVARSNIDLADVNAFRSSYGLPLASVQVLVNGSDPGILSSTGDDVEADLAVEWSGAVAKGATVVLVVSADTTTSDGIDLSSQYIVDHNVAPVVSSSFGTCETDNGSFNDYYNNLWQQAVAQGMSVFVASGDNGSAGCDDPSATSPASRGFAVNGLGSTPYNVAVGGSEFNENGNDPGYWSSSNTPAGASVKSYIPEVVWNESTFVTFNDPGNGLWAGGGGVSILYSTPSWQKGPGVPASDPGTVDGHHRYVPDVSLAAADHDGYRVKSEGATYRVSGTSASTPSFAGIMALVNQYTNGRNGNPNPQLYALAQSQPSVFHDVVSGSNAVPCSIGFLGCTGAQLALGVAHMGGFSAGPGYDLATGLGSVDIYQLVTGWPANSSGGGGGGGGGSGGPGSPPPPGLVSLSGAHLATGGGWETLIELINPTGTDAIAHVRIYDDKGNALSIPFSAPDAGINTTATGLDPPLAPKSVLILRSAAPASGPVLLGSAEVTSDTRISGFLIFRWTATEQEVLVPLSSSAASSYVVAFDNTGGLATGISFASSSLKAASVGVVARDRNGLVVANGTIAVPRLGHQSFVVSAQFPALANQRGTLEFTPPGDAQISVIGIRATPSGAFTGIPVLASGANGSGNLADLASGGGWETLIELVNSSGDAAQAHLRFFDDTGAQLALPVTSSDLGLDTSTASVDAALPAGASALLSSAGAAGSVQQNGSARLTSDRGVTGFLIFRFTATGQEVLVPVQSGSANSYVIAFDQTNGLSTGISLSNSTVQMANVFVTLRDQNGVSFATSTITLQPQGHKAFVLTDLFPAAAGKYGTVEIDPPLGGQIGVVGIRATRSGAFTSVPVLAP